MKPMNAFLLEMDLEKAYKINIAGKEMYLDAVFEKYKNAVQDGIVRYTPACKTGYEGHDLPEVGDKVYVHHFTHENKIEWEGSEYFQDGYENLYCKVVDGEIIMLNDYVLIEPLKEQESDFTTESGIMLKSSMETIKNRGIVRHLPKGALEYGLKPGDTVMFTENSDYDITVEGDMYYLMRMKRDIPVKIENDELHVLGDWAVMLPLDESDEYVQLSNGLYVQNHEKVEKCKAEILHLPDILPYRVKEGDKVMFDKRQFLSGEWKDKKVYFTKMAYDPFWAIYKN